MGGASVELTGHSSATAQLRFRGRHRPLETALHLDAIDHSSGHTARVGPGEHGQQVERADFSFELSACGAARRCARCSARHRI